jgi:hypothetical protein
MKLSSVITEARRLLQDNTVPYRYSDTVLLGFANQALKRMSVLRPDLFAYLTTIATPLVQTSSQSLQTASASWKFSKLLVEMLLLKQAVSLLMRHTPAG